MPIENYRQMIDDYKKIGIDDSRLRKKVKQAITEHVIKSDENLDYLIGKAGFDDHYGSKRAAIFFRQLSEALSVQWFFLEQLHQKWPGIYIGSEIIDLSQACLDAMKREIEFTTTRFQMYVMKNEEHLPKREQKKFSEFNVLSREIIELLLRLIGELDLVERKLSKENRDRSVSSLEPIYFTLKFMIAKFRANLQDLSRLTESSST